MSEKPWLAFYEKRVPKQIIFPKLTLNDLLIESAQKYPDNVATNFVLRCILGGKIVIGGKLTYAHLNAYAERFAASLARLGVKKGDRVAIMLPNSPHFIIAFFAAAKLGAIVVNTNPTYTARELKHQLQDSGAETIILLNLFKPRLDEIKAETPVKRTIVAYIYDTLQGLSKSLVRSRQRKEKDWVEVKREMNLHFFADLIVYPGEPPKTKIVPDDIALFQYTGGTTGQPKAAMLTHRNLVTNTLQTEAWSDGGQADKMMAAIPYFHVYGLTVCMLYGIRLGLEQIVVPNPRPIENVMKLIQLERCAIFPGVPAMYIGIINHPNVHKYNLKSVRFCISGSAPLPHEVQQRFEEITGGKLVEGYGLTEASPVTHCNPVFGEHREGIGLPYPETEAKLIDLETGASLPFDGESRGELCVRGPQVMKGYWQREQDTANTIDPEGWLHTGDICVADPDGYFKVVDRKKDMIIASGFKVLPRDVEEVLFTHPAVQEAVVVGIPSTARGDELVKAFVVLKPNQTLTTDELRAFCAKELAPYKVPREFAFRAELPKTAVGKVLRRVLVEEEKMQQ
jgi:long-chain acyl-CoA synthetase